MSKYPINKWFIHKRWDSCRYKPMTYYFGIIKITKERKEEGEAREYKGIIFELSLPFRVNFEFSNKPLIKRLKK